MNRCLEQQHVIQNLNLRVNSIEAKTANMSTQVNVLTTSVAAATAAVTVSETR